MSDHLVNLTDDGITSASAGRLTRLLTIGKDLFDRALRLLFSPGRRLLTIIERAEATVRSQETRPAGGRRAAGRWLHCSS
jgi:hypothetical protein